VTTQLQLINILLMSVNKSYLLLLRLVLYIDCCNETYSKIEINLEDKLI